jgi:ADP-heptose:LPS heptosyltransferase
MIKKINLLRKAILLKLTSSLMHRTSLKAAVYLKQKNIKRILVVRPNHRLGNLILVSALIKELENSFPKAKIDLIAKGGLAKIIFQNYSSINQIYQLPKKPFKHPIAYLSLFFKIRRQPYDLAISAVNNSSSGRIFTSFSNASNKITDDEISETAHNDKSIPVDYHHIAKQQIYQLRRYIQ